MFASGASVYLFEANKIYGSGRTIILPEGSSLITQGSTFYKLFGSANPMFMVQANVNADSINVSMRAGVNIDRALRISGSDVNLGSVYVESTVDSFTSSGTRAIEIESTDSTTLRNINIDYLGTSRVACALLTRNVTHLTVRAGLTEYYRVAYYLRDTANSTFSDIICRYTAQSSDGSAGENAVLIEGSAPRLSSNLEFNRIVAEDSGEHGFRLGGGKTISDVTFNSCIARRSGSSIKVGNPSSTAWHGGCGFKVLGSTVELYQKHINIYFNNCIVEDIDEQYGTYPTGHGLYNYAAFQIGVASNVHMNSCAVRATSANTYSCPIPVEIIASDRIYITNCAFRDASSYFRIYQAAIDDPYVGWHLPSENIIVQNCTFEPKEYLDSHIYIGNLNNNYYYKNIRFLDCSFINARRIMRQEIPLNGTKYDTIVTGTIERNPVDTMPVVTGATTDILLDVRATSAASMGDFYARRGSRVQDLDTDKSYYLGYVNKWFQEFTQNRFTVTLQPDTATSINYSENLVGMYTLTSSSSAYALVGYRLGGAPYCNALVATDNVAARTGDLTGTTGIAGKINISSSAGNNIFIENRTASAITITLTMIS